MQQQSECVLTTQVTTGSVPVSMASVIIHIPQYTKDKNPLMYLTGVHTDQVKAAKLPIKMHTSHVGTPRGGVIMPALL